MSAPRQNGKSLEKACGLRASDGEVDEAAAARAEAAMARRVKKKIDWRLIPILLMLYAVAFLDRVNIGNARLWNLEDDLKMTKYDYNIAVLVFYIPYICLGIPANMILTRVRPRYWVGGLAIAWGLTITMVGFTKSFTGLVVGRVLLGCFEAGMFPGCMFIINAWYCRHELTTRMAFFMLSTDVAGVFSGLLGAGIGSLEGTGGFSGWSWIFFIEGAMTTLAGVIALFLTLDFPDDSDFLPPDEKAWLLQRFAADDGRKAVTKMTFSGVFHALLDWKVLMSGILYMCACITAYSVAVFAPTILATFGWDNVKANLLSAPLRVASAISAISMGIASDKLKIRGPFCIGAFILGIVGNCCVGFLTKGGLRYMGLYFMAIGVNGVQPLIIAWCVNQVVGTDKRGTSTALGGSMGQIGGIISAVAFPKRDSPQYVPGCTINVSFLCIGIAAAGWLWGWTTWENRQRDLGRRDQLRELSEEEQKGLGEQHPDFRFTP